jgi:hypothetical protein
MTNVGPMQRKMEPYLGEERREERGERREERGESRKVALDGIQPTKRSYGTALNVQHHFTNTRIHRQRREQDPQRCQFFVVVDFVVLPVLLGVLFGFLFLAVVGPFQNVTVQGGESFEHCDHMVDAFFGRWFNGFLQKGTDGACGEQCRATAAAAAAATATTTRITATR